MYGIIFEIHPFIKTSIALCLTALSIKLFDDILDADKDAAAQRVNWQEHFGKATALYAAWTLLVASLLDVRWTIAFFGTAYVMGMIQEGGDAIAPGHFVGWQRTMLPWLEVGIALGISLMLTNALYIAAAYCTLQTIQRIDNIVDRELEAIAFNPRELQWLIVLFFALCAWLIAPGVFVVSLSISLMIILSTRGVASQENRTR